MTGTPKLMTETPNLDLLSDVLRRVRLASAVFLRGEFTAPWAFESTDAATLCAVVRPGAKRLVLFHVVVQGKCRISIASGESALAQAGDALVLPYCDQHTMGYPDGTPPVPIAALFPMPPWKEMPVVRIAGGGEPTRILCGYLHCDDLLFNPLLKALPRLVHVRPTSPQAAQWRETSVRYVLEQSRRPGGATLLNGLPELVLADCLRQHIAELPESQGGWLGALKDPVLGRALTLLHAQPEHGWTVEELARRAAVSRSVLAERFKQSLGVTPMRYLAQWRLQIAAELLRTSDLNLAVLAQRVGYESEAAFSRAFKRHLGVPPASWRERAS